ncbi:hypothetical protein Tco_0032963 [Tanacetum coccineum]
MSPSQDSRFMGASHYVEDSGMQQDQKFVTGDDDKQPADKEVNKADWFKKPERPPTIDPDWSKRQQVDFRPPQTWISQATRAKEPPTSFDEFNDTSFDFSAFVMNQLKIPNLTQEILVGPHNPENEPYPFDLRKPLPLIQDHRGRQIILKDYFINKDQEYLKGGDLSKRYSTSVIKTKAATYELKWIEHLVHELWSPVVVKYDQHAYLGTSHWAPKRQSFYGYASSLTSSKDVYSKRRIIAVTRLIIMKKYDYGHLEEIEVHRDDQQLYTFKEGIEDMVPNIWVTVKVAYDKHALWGISHWREQCKTFYGYARGLESRHDVYSMKCILAVTQVEVMRKHGDGTLTRLLTSLQDITNNIHMEYLPKRRWSLLEKKRAHIMIKAINKLLKERRIMRSLENQNRRDLPRDIPLDSVVVLRYEKRSKSENKGKVPTEMELVLEQTQQGTSYEVSVDPHGFEGYLKMVMEVMAISVILVLSDSSEESVRTSTRRFILFGTIPTTIPNTTPFVIPPSTHIDTALTPTSPDYTPASPDYSPASDTESDPSDDPLSDHILPLPTISPFLSLTNDSSDSDTPDTPLSPTHGTPFTEMILSTQSTLVAPGAFRDRVMILAPGQPIPHGRPYCYHLNGSIHIMTARKRVGPLPTHRLAMRYSVDYSSLDYFASDDSSRDSSSSLSSKTSSDPSSDDLSDSSSDHSLPSPLSGMRPSHHLCSLVPSIPRSSAAISDGPSHDSSSASLSRKRSRSPAAFVPLSSLIPRVLSSARADLLPSPKRIRSPDQVRGINARVVVEAVHREIEMGTRGPVEVRVDRFTHPVIADDIPELAQEERVVEVTYKTLGDLVQGFHDHTKEIPVHRV